MKNEQLLKIYTNTRCRKKPDLEKLGFLMPEEAEVVEKFHRSIPGYAPTPLHKLGALAEMYGLGGIWVKDESQRFGLNSFKGLGGIAAVAKIVAERLEMDPADLDYQQLVADETRERLGEVTFITATDGNHGRGVAWAAAQMGQKAVVLLPAGTANHRLQAILDLGAEASIVELNYDDAVRLAAKKAKKNNWILVQDTASSGYEKVPRWVMQGYTTMAAEAARQLADAEVAPTHIFLQAGVGSMAAAVLGWFVVNQTDSIPRVAIVEPADAACFYKSMRKADGKAYGVAGGMETMMAGLACGEPNPLAWKVVRDYASWGIKCADYVAARGMRMLKNPLPRDPEIISGESGAVGLGVLAMLMENPMNREIVKEMGLNKSSQVLLISTEGNTDPINYQRVLWG
jgi:diaminopropionate ammonia-lyase